MRQASASATAMELLSTSQDGRHIRTRWVRALMTLLDGQLGVTQNLSFDPENNMLHNSDVIGVGSSEFEQAVAMADGSRVDDFSDVETAIPMDRFTAFERSTVSPAIRDSFWLPFDIESSLSTSMTDNGRFIGSISIFRTAGGAETFRGNELSTTLRPWANATRTILTATHAMLCKGPRQRGAMLFKPDGTGWMANELPVDWAGTAYREALASLVRSFAESDRQEEDLLMHSTRVRLLEMSGDGETGILVLVEPLVVPTVGELFFLTPTERLVASYAARGASNKDIAVQLSRSPATIKSHLGRVYEQLCVSSRVELAALFEDAWAWN